MCEVNIQEDIRRLDAAGVLGLLLKDKTTRKNIIWATDGYSSFGKKYEKGEQITKAGARKIQARASKAKEEQAGRTKKRGEVFTPVWIIEKMNAHVQKEWHRDNAKKYIVKKEKEGKERYFDADLLVKYYTDNRMLEITCGEAPFICTRYDPENGKMINVDARVGFLDDKLATINTYVDDEKNWWKWAKRAFQASYGYEFQGDSLLIARVNLMCTFEDYLKAKWNRVPTKQEYKEIANIVCWNIWQMDGLTGHIPYATIDIENPDAIEGQIDLLDEVPDDIPQEADEKLRCRIFNWRSNESLNFLTARKETK